ncbi:hypothetical protein [Streptomyces bobili]|uniref:hypothetical protein n=1 Tax=Streptomyces bobili TaxID=67280 RepID=UPI000A3810C0|nr:hypothetical protein [Streptomyces bobili]
MSVTYMSADVLALLDLPDPSGLTADQRRGAVCVWGPEPLTGESAEGLGEQVDESGERWFPRACKKHTAKHAHGALVAHAAICKQCTDDADACDIHRVLYRLVRQEWR